jgi:5-methyltetrahydropteroyltriglutamate--homocysteine methyltransferase
VKLSEDRFYRNEKKMLFKIAQILNEEAIDLAKAGAEIIQLDEPALNFGKPPIKDCIEAIDIVFAGINKKKALYTYFGKLEKSLLAALQRSCVDIIGVDIVSDPKALALIRQQKWVKGLAIGCLDARNTKLETKTQLHKAFDVATKLVPCDRLYVNPSCGLEFLPYEQARQKLDCLVESVKSYNPKSQVLCCARKAGN